MSKDESLKETKKLGAYSRQRKVKSQKIEKRYQKRRESRIATEESSES